MCAPDCQRCGGTSLWHADIDDVCEPEPRLAMRRCAVVRYRIFPVSVGRLGLTLGRYLLPTEGWSLRTTADQPHLIRRHHSHRLHARTAIQRSIRSGSIRRKVARSCGRLVAAAPRDAVRSSHSPATPSARASRTDSGQSYKGRDCAQLAHITYPSANAAQVAKFARTEVRAECNGLGNASQPYH